MRRRLHRPRESHRQKARPAAPEASWLGDLFLVPQGSDDSAMPLHGGFRTDDLVLVQGLVDRSAGLKTKAQSLLDLLARDPFETPPRFEKLVGDLAGAYSRRINLQHRLVYQVIPDQRVVKVLRLWTHYEYERNCPLFTV